MKRAGLFFVLSLLAAPALAHRDRILSLRPDGVIPELPAADSQTRMHIEYAKGGGLRSLRFVSSGRQTDVERCVLERFPTAAPRVLGAPPCKVKGKNQS